MLQKQKHQTVKHCTQRTIKRQIFVLQQTLPINTFAHSEKSQKRNSTNKTYTNQTKCTQTKWKEKKKQKEKQLQINENN